MSGISKKVLSSLIFMTLLLSGCSSLSLPLSTPFKQVAEETTQSQYLVVVTFTEYKEDAVNEKRFNELTENIVENIKYADGLFGYSVRKDFLGNTAWTYTIWDDIDAMAKFKVADYHLEAMKEAGSLLNQASFARTYIGADELNYSWEEALALVETEGRTYSFSASKESHPTYYSSKY